MRFRTKQKDYSKESFNQLNVERSLLQDSIPMMTKHYKKVILFGDSQFERSCDPSLSFCFPSALSYYYGRRADVLNRGLSGYSSKWLRSQLSRVIAELEVLERELNQQVAFLFIFWLGTNDSCVEGVEHHVPISEFLRNVRSIISDVHSAFPHARVLLVTPAPISISKIRDSNLRSDGSDRTQVATKEYADALLHCPVEIEPEKLRRIDLFEAIAAASGAKITENTVEELQTIDVNNFTVDGLHLNGDAYRILYKLVLRELENWPGMATKDIDGVEPGWAAKAKQFKEAL
ncbi:SGNH hydrolase-type esterase domain-containing protein [Lipomyces oligophaga]|uniref:SGNH hydrolase-type esterase domain-containing protein n=1 Tax=Lipomyces oligophaga TaxID=45792 RepID=UPI0034CF5522